MRRRIGLGTAIGLVVAAMSWRGNNTAGHVSTLPDGVTFAALAILVAVAIRFDARNGDASGRSVSWRAGFTIATTSGVVFGLAVALIGLLRFSHPSPSLLAFGFLTAVGSALACGAVAVAIFRKRPHARAA